jgi:ubiquinone/menaquinone biosynthesis C-methylase UbiE
MSSSSETPTAESPTAESAAADALVSRLSAAETLPDLPEIVDLARAVPPNPPEAVQTQFVGRSYEDAYTEAASFVRIVDEWLIKHTKRGLGARSRVLDFGSGWGRITRLLLTQVPPTSIYAVDVDPQMTALLNTTLPGVNALTVTALPPTVLADASIDSAVAFSVFSHLAPHAHEAWAAEFGRVVAPGGMVFITLMDAVFLSQIREAKEQVAAGTAVPFHVGMAPLFDDIDAAEAAFNAGEAVYSPSGGGGVRTEDFYGWAAMPAPYIDRVWGAAGFEVVEWVRSGVVFGQAMVGLARRPGPGSANPSRRAGRPGLPSRVLRRLRASAG